MQSLADPGSWQALLIPLLGLGMVTLILLGVRLLVMQTLQRRRERENRQINERLRSLIAAYKTLGGSFTGDLDVDPAHLRNLAARTGSGSDDVDAGGAAQEGGSDRRRRIRDAVEAALSDVILLGTADQVELAVAAARDLVAGRKVQTGALVVALRDYIRQALDLEPLPALEIPRQGPTRTVSSAARRDSGAPGRSGGGGGGGGAGGGGGGAGGVGVGAAGVGGLAGGRGLDGER